YRKMDVVRLRDGVASLVLKPPYVVCCTDNVRFWHKADLPRCLLFVRSRGQSGQADLTAFFLIPARTNEKPCPYVTADVVSGKPATKGSASTSRYGHTCEVPPTRKEVNASPRAQSCSHRSDLP